MIDDSEASGWQEQLEPPPGGLAALRRRLARRERRRRNLRRAASSCAVLALTCTVALFWMARDKAPAPLPGGDDLLAIRLGLREPQSEPATITPSMRGSAALMRVPTTDERVAFYLVGVLPAPEPES